MHGSPQTAAHTLRQAGTHLAISSAQSFIPDTVPVSQKWPQLPAWGAQQQHHNSLCQWLISMLMEPQLGHVASSLLRLFASHTCAGWSGKTVVPALTCSWQSSEALCQPQV